MQHIATVCPLTNRIQLLRILTSLCGNTESELKSLIYLSVYGEPGPMVL